jgi:Zn-dependent protease with chaperone function
VLTTGVVLSLAWFTVVNAAASICAGAAAARVAPRAGAGWLLAIRLGPAVLSTVFVLAVFAPAHWRFEPRGAQDAFGLAVYALAAVGAWLLARALGRAATVARAGWQLRAASVLAADGRGGPPVYEARGLGGVSLAGVLRPRIFVSPEARASLTRAELDAAVAHELAHHEALDNVKRFAMVCAPDFLAGTSAGRRVEEQWRAAAEWIADARAVSGDPSRALHLAAALVKVARLAAPGAAVTASPAWSTLHEGPLLERRVKRLVSSDAPSAGAPRRALPVAASLGALLAAAALGAAAAPRLHQLTEILAHLVP